MNFSALSVPIGLHQVDDALELQEGDALALSGNAILAGQKQQCAARAFLGVRQLAA